MAQEIFITSCWCQLQTKWDLVPMSAQPLGPPLQVHWRSLQLNGTSSRGRSGAGQAYGWCFVPAAASLMSRRWAGPCSRAGWLHSCRLCWELARAHLKPPFPFGSLALLLCIFPFPAAALWEGQTVPWQLEVEDFEGKMFLVVMRTVNLFYLLIGICTRNYMPAPDGCHTFWPPAQLLKS